MYYKTNFIKLFQEKNYRLSIYAFIILSLSFLFLTGCNDSDSLPPDDEVPPIVEQLTDAEMMLFQDGDGDWRQIDESELTEAGIFIPPVTDSQGRYGLAYLVADAEDQRVQIVTLQITTAELPQIDVSRALEEGVTTDTAALEINVGEPDLAGSRVHIFLRDEGSSSNFDFTCTYSDLHPGNYDLFLTQTESEKKYPATLFARRDLELDADDTLVQDITTADLADSIDLTGPYTVTVLDQQSGDPLDSNIFDGNVGLFTTNLTYVELGDKYVSDPDLKYTALGTPLTDNYIYILDLDIEIDDNHSLYYVEAFLDEGNKEITLPVQLDDFNLTFAEDISTGSLLPGMHISDIEDVTVMGYIISFEGNINGIRYYSKSYISASRQTDTSFFMPDLSSAEEWESNWSMPADIETEYYSIHAYIGSGNFIDQSLQDASDWGYDEALYQQLEDGDWFAHLSESTYLDPL